MMVYHGQIWFFISVILSVEGKIVQKELESDYGIDQQKDWSQQKWDTIMNHYSCSDVSEKSADGQDKKATKNSHLCDKSHNKKLENKFNHPTEKEFEDLKKDEVFIDTGKMNEENEKKSKYQDVVDKIKGLGSVKAPVDRESGFPKPKQLIEEGFFIPSDRNSESIETEKSGNLDFDDFDLKKKLVSTETTTTVSLDKELVSTKTATTVPPPDSSIPNESSFIFNPQARPQEKFQNCTTPKNESGNCRYLQHCLIPSIVSSLDQFMGYVCIIEGMFIGVCCPNLPATVIVLQKEKKGNKTEEDSTEECGVSSITRIVGGLKADPKAWPWMVALISKSSKKFFCGGALISDRYVLTAAHCTFGIPNNEIVARLGEYDFKDDGESHQEYAVHEIKRHGHYSQRTLINDIALLKLSEPVAFSKFVKKICFPEEEKNYVGENATLAGWGNFAGGGATSNVLLEASLPVISNEECAKAYSRSIPQSLICTSSTSGDKGACNGDSGGPLMLLDKNDRWKAIGLVSWGRSGCDPKFPTVYTRVSHYLDWIQKHSSPS